MNDPYMHLLVLAFIGVATGILAWVAIKVFLFAIGRMAHDKECQLVNLERFHDSAARFMRNTNDHDHRRHRDTVLFFADSLARDKGAFAKHFFITRNGREMRDAKPPETFLKEFDLMSPEAKQALGSAIQEALIASTFELHIVGPIIRMGLAADRGGPEQTVYRMTKASKAVLGKGGHEPLAA